MKPETFLILGVLAALATMAMGRFLGERNYASLSREDKLKMVDAFTGHRSVATYIPIGIMLVIIALGYLDPRNFFFALPLGVVLILIILVMLQVAMYRRMRELAVADDYLRKFVRNTTLVQIGNIVALSLLVYGAVGSFFWR